jgi:uncharacterized protein (DUF2147 family)
VILLSFSVSSFATEADEVLGVWWSLEQKTKVQISKNDNIYYGRIIAVRPESKDLLDTHHPDESLRTRQVLGLEILSGFKFDGDDTWEKGSIYDPENGKTYKCKMWFDKKDVLKIRGYIGFSLLGRTVEFTKVTGPHPLVQQEGEPIKVHLPLK